MLPAVLAALLAAPALGQVDPAKDASVRQELQRLQGGWQVEDMEEDGAKLAPEKAKSRVLFFGRDTFILREDGKLISIAMLKLDLSKKLRTFNAMVVQGHHKGEVLLGIYERDGDKLRVCVDTRGDGRPKEFKSEPDSGRVVMHCKRIANANDQPDLSGVYRSESTEIDGSKHVADAIIERMGDAYMVSYQKGGAVAFMGVGIRKGDVFCMSWISQGQVGITLYQVEKNQRLVGLYTRLGGPGVLSQEILTRKDFD